MGVVRNSLGAYERRMTYQKKFALAKLLGCYFHQDWADEFDSDITALRAMTELEPKSQVVAGLSEIDWLLTQNLAEEDLRTILVDEIGCYFEPASKGVTWKEWLQQVRSVFSES
jgi:hypothetical protein